jgi:hypothetical protein
MISETWIDRDCFASLAMTAWQTFAVSQDSFFQYSSIPPFPPGHRPNGPEANWGEAPNLHHFFLDHFTILELVPKWSSFFGVYSTNENYFQNSEL